MSRKTARRYAFELIFQIPFHTEFDIVSAFEIYPEDNLPTISESERIFVIETITGVYKHLHPIDKCIEDNSEGWCITRIKRVDLAVLRLAVYEMLFTDTPVKISINEAVYLTKIYSGEESGAYVNGILGKISKQSEARHA